jgi:probable phosphoglycerate mutase
VRHGQSAGNVAREDARLRGAGRIEVTARDVDVELSDLGRRQAVALGEWFASFPSAARPEVVLSSPYVRALETMAAVRLAGGLACAEATSCIDERLREREFGILDRLTGAGIREFHPEQAELRRAIGKFYHRPPGGESWCDVILRLRSLLDTLALHHAERQVLIVCHHVVVLCLRYLLEGLSEADILAIDRAAEVANCSVTEYALTPEGSLDLVRYNFTGHLEEAGAPVTKQPDIAAGVR